ncbi:Polyadenylate-binding protein-interacting protein 7 [Erysiphe necator]|uniref:Putative smr domain-containing protein n=1 Tax=Uncinula necator TaxID=52586 RepID=A0A0B1PDZ8_UNCNE|nr:Polyadenylate-binding protein-interacting protein 7 [Erysiphe necator]KHJ34829.1 putative smr domain-containing protein [Erysiphe necator]
MVSDQTYEICLPVLKDVTLDDEVRTDKIEELLRKETNLAGTSLENTVLDILWRHREETIPSSPSLPRNTILRRPSPSPWPVYKGGASTPASSSPQLEVSPLAPPGFRPTLTNRAKSSTISPFNSPQPSPQLAFSSPAILHSPSLNTYEFPTNTSPPQDVYGDYGSENVDWLVNDNTGSNKSSAGGHIGLNAAAAEYIQPQQSDMSPYDMLRSILGPSKSDEEIESALAMHGFDLSATITAFMDGQTGVTQSSPNEIVDPKNAVLIGKSMALDIPRPTTPAGQQRSGVVCRFWSSTGQCLRADCRFSHDLGNHICKYWIMGSCLAGDTCIFSHDPTHFINRLALEANTTPPLHKSLPIQYQDLNVFPSLQPSPSDWSNTFKSPSTFNNYQIGSLGMPPSLIKATSCHSSDSSNQKSRPNSGHQISRDMKPIAPALDDTDAFPSLGAVVTKGGKKYHNKRGGHGYTHKENFTPSSLAELVKMSPSPGPTQSRQDSKKIGKNWSTTSFRNGENSKAAHAIPSPQHIPWLETGVKANKAYLKARQDAIKHGILRNKFLQSAAQAWNRNDARAAKALSLRGQTENDYMRKAHREAARQLYEERNRGSLANTELYLDLHGLHPDEAVEYLERVLLENQNEIRPIYAIIGTGHHSKNGKDKVGKSVRSFLNEWRYVYCEFSVPGDRNNIGGILGIDARSYDKTLGRERPATPTASKVDELDILSQGHEIGQGKVRLLVRDPPKSVNGSR